MVEKFKNLKLSAKMALVYTGFAGIFLLISAFALQLSFHIFSGELYEKSLQELNYYVQGVKNSLEEIEARSYDLALDEDVQETFVNIAKADVKSLEYRKLLTDLRYKLIYAYNPASAVRSIAYTDNHGTTVETGVRSWDIPDESYRKAVEIFQEANGAFKMYGPNEQCPYILCGRSVRNSLDMSLNSIGTVIMSCDVSKIIEEYKSNLESPNASLIVYSRESVIYQDNDSIDKIKELPAMEEKEGYKIIKYEEKEYFMCWTKSKMTNWMYVNFFPYSDIYGQLSVVRYSMLICFGVAFIVIVLIMNKVSKIITRPLYFLTESMQTVEIGNFEQVKKILVDKNRKDEVGILTQEFQTMIERIDSLIHENYEKQILLKDTKYQMLQAQINPHFLYNTLNTLQWMIRAGKKEDAGRMIVELGQLLRASFSKESYATAEEELQMVGSYIAIQKMRYKNRVQFHVEVDENLGEYVVPRMLLQPFVENALYYGADTSTKECQIWVRAKEEKDNLFFEIEDTGRGMNEEELEKVRNFTIEPKGHGIGIKNICERLKILYDDFEFRIESELNKGTKIQMHLPKVLKTSSNKKVM